MTPKQVLQMIKDKGAMIVDLKFMDLLGQWQHFTAPISEFQDESPFEEGLGFDGSSIRGWQAIHDSDMLVIPDPDTAVIDPFTKEPTLTLICNIVDPITRADYSRDPRNIARKAEAYLKSTGIGDTAYFGPEPEFFIFDGIRYDTNRTRATTTSSPNEGDWNSGREGTNLGYKPRYKEGYFPVPPNDSLQDIRTEMVREMETRRHPGRKAAPRGRHRRPGRNRHALPVAGQDGRLADLVQVHLQERRDPPRQDRDLHAQADLRRQRLRHAHPSEHLEGRDAAVRRLGLRGDVGDGAALHRRHPASRAGAGGLHQSGHQLVSAAGAGLRGAGQPGLLQPQPLGRRAHPDVFAVAQGQADRVPLPRPDLQSVPGLLGDADGGLDGIQNRLDPGQPLDKDIYALTPAELAEVPNMPPSLEAALDNLKRDHEFLLKGDVFTEDLIETWIDYKMSNEVSAIRLRPHPYEFALYYDA